MITFKKVTFKNLLSNGNKVTEILFKTGDTTLIVGSNGAGKSQIYEALFFALYGKPFRKIKKDQLVNSINKKELVVTLEFENGSNNIIVTRGIKPNIFEIDVNGNKKESEASIIKEQLAFEQNYLNISESTFRQIVILGSTSYVPFMMLSTLDRTKVINDLLDLEIYQVMLGIARKKYNILKKDLIDIEKNVLRIQKTIEKNNSNIDDITLLVNNEAEDLDDDINNITKTLKDLENTLINNDKKFRDINFEDILNEKQNHQLSVKKVIEIKTKMKSKVSGVNKDLNFFKENAECPTCNQDITKELKDEKVKTYKEQLKDIETYRLKVENMALELDTKLKHTNARIEDFNALKRTSDNIQKDVDNEKLNLKNSKDRQEKFKNGTNKITLDILQDELDDNKDNLTNEKKKGKICVIDNKNYDNVIELLKDSGIKSQIITTYLPVINSLIQKYLEILEYQVGFVFDEGFNETIKSRGRDFLSYHNLSEGEKMRINLSLLFTFRELSKIKNAAQTNLLVIDEIGGNNLDAAGIRGFNRIIKENSEHGCTLIISHDAENIKGVNKIIKVEKVGNFSTYKIEE